MDQRSPKIDFDPVLVRQNFDKEPFGFSHNLHRLDLFTQDAMQTLASRYAGHPRDFFVAAGAAQPGQVFRQVLECPDTPSQAIELLDKDTRRILLKRPELHDSRFRDLLDELFDQVLLLRAGTLARSDIVRLESAILISSSKTMTPFHFDPEIGFFSQIKGEKLYHVYAPTVLSENDLETFYSHAVVDIGQVDLATCDQGREIIYHLQPGMGLHQPQDAPHWVQTGDQQSVSYTFVFETEKTRARGHARAFNHYQRALGLQPSSPGQRPTVDAVKANTMQLALPLRKFLGRQIRSVMSR